MITTFSCTSIQIVCVHGCLFLKYLTHFMNELYPGCLESKGLKNVFLIAATSNQKTYTNHWLTQQRKDADVPRANNCIFKRKDILENWFLFRELRMIFCWTSPITPRPLQSILIDKQLTKGVQKPLHDKCKLVIYVLQLAPNAISWLRTSQPPNNNLKDKNLVESLVTQGKHSTLRRPTLLNSENLYFKKILRGWALKTCGIIVVIIASTVLKLRHKLSRT